MESSHQWLTAVAVLVAARRVGLVAPHYAPETPGSRRTIIAIRSVWILGGLLGGTRIALAAKGSFSKRR